MALTKVTSGLISADASSVDLNIDAGTLYIDSTNNRVGIGTSSVRTGYKLDVQEAADNGVNIQAGNASADIALSVGSASTADKFVIQAGGNVGIGTSSPSTVLHIKDSTNTALTIEGDSSAGATFINLSADSNATKAQISSAKEGASGGRLILYTSNSSGTSTERMRIDSSGNVNIGTTAAATGSHKLVVESASTTGTVNSHIALIGDSATNGQGPQILFSESGDGQSYAGGTIGFARTGSNSIGDLIFGTRGSAGDANTTTTERMRITSSGFVKMSQDGNYHNLSGGYYEMISPDATLVFLAKNTSSNPYGQTITFTSSPDNNANRFLHCEDGTASRLFIFSDGDVQNHDNAYGGISDEKLKQDITDAGSQWDDIKNLRVRKFKFKSDVEAYGDDAKTLIGLVAQEAELVSPHLVKDNPDLDEEHNDLGTVTKTIKYSILYMKAVKALQEAMTRIEDLEARIQTLEGE